MMSDFCVALFLTVFIQRVVCDEIGLTLVADINVPGLVGSVTFTQEKPLYPIFIRTQLQPESSNRKYGWEIHQMPVLWGYSDELYCSKSVFNSPMLHNLTERHGLMYSRAMYNDEFMSVFAFKESIAGMTLVIVDPNIGVVSCSTILPLIAKQTLLVAKFHRNIAGELHFFPYFQTEKNKVLIFGVLYKVDGISTITEHEWYIGSKVFDSDDADCFSYQTGDVVFDPTNKGSTSGCNWYDGNGCAMGNMSAKHGPLLPGVSLDWSTARPFALRDPHLVIQGNNGVAWHTLYLQDTTGRLVSCAIIKPAKEVKFRSILRKRTNVDALKIFGTVYLIQLSPWHSTFAKIVVKEHPELSINGSPPTFAIFDLLPKGPGCDSIGTIMMTDDKKVKVLLSPGQFNEYNKDSIHNGTLDVGCVSGFTLFGHKSVLGKTLAVFREFTPDHHPQECGQIMPSRVEETLVLMANFSHGNQISGYVMMVQYLLNDKFMQFSDVLTIMDLTNRNWLTTINHKYHIHLNPPTQTEGVGNPTLNCESTRYHYNPFNVSTAQPMYDYECNSEFPMRCEIGDLNGKHGLIDIGRTRRQFVDSSLKLYGPTTVQGQSLVIHGEGRQKTMTDCAKIEKYTP